MTSSTLDYLELCRLCLVKDRVQVPIFDDDHEVGQTFLKIHACLPVKVSVCFSSLASAIFVALGSPLSFYISRIARSRADPPICLAFVVVIAADFTLNDISIASCT